MATIVVLLGMGCLMVDFGYLTAIKSRVQSTADAASMAGALRLRSEYDDPIVSDINSMAIKYAEYNQPSNPGVLAPADVEIGAWDAEMGAFIKDAFDANAVRVTVRRNNQQSNSVSLFLANVFGKQNCDVSASAVCTFEVTQDAEGNFEMSRPYIVQ
jgi:Flp pilus assembly protein TadG